MKKSFAYEILKKVRTNLKKPPSMKYLTSTSKLNIPKKGSEIKCYSHLNKQKKTHIHEISTLISKSNILGVSNCF